MKTFRKRARNFLQQAYETLHAPDAAAVMAGSAIDAMLKHHNYTTGSLYDRIDKALADNLLTKGMADWAHEVRLGSNRPRHADKDKPSVSLAEAAQSVEFAEALGNFLFVLTARIDRGLKGRAHKIMMARIGVLRALNRHVERVFNPEKTRIGESAS